MFHTATHLLRCVCRSLRAPWRNPLAKSPSALLSHCWQRVRILSNYSCYYHDSSSSSYYYYYYYDDDYYGVSGSVSLSLCFRIVVVLCAHCPLVVMTPLGIAAR